MNTFSPVRVFLLASLASVLTPSLVAQQKTTPAATAGKSDTSSQSPAPSSSVTTLSVDARLVNLPVVVRDKKGALIQNLTKDDFSLQVDGKPQTIRYFDRDTNLPLTLGLLVDSSFSQRKVLDDERTASRDFLDQMLTTQKDKAFIAQFSRQTELLQDITPSRPLLQAALREIDTPGDDSDSGHRGGTTLYDALFLASDELMSKQAGRKALIILSDGVDRNSKENLVKSIEAAQRSDTIIYAIYFKGEESQSMNNNNHRGGGFPGGRGGYGYPGGGYPGGGYPGGGGRGGNNGGNNPTTTRTDGKKILERMTQETGGRFFEAKKGQDVAPIYNQIAEELRAQYRLGYTPTQEASSNGYHQIDLTTHKKDLTVQTRDGYYTGK